MLYRRGHDTAKEVLKNLNNLTISNAFVILNIIKENLENLYDQTYFENSIENFEITMAIKYTPKTLR
jgi:hypothetical protein